MPQIILKRSSKNWKADFINESLLSKYSKISLKSAKTDTCNTYKFHAL